MKIGIVTFYHVSNYGAVLQAFALKAYLEQRGHVVFFINDEYTRREKFTILSILCSRNLQVFRNKLQHNQAIDTFRSVFDGFHDTDIRYSNASMLKENYPQADAYIVGSDQMWNPTWCMEYADLLFLNFGLSDTKRIAYAVSLGAASWPKQTRSEASELMSKFDAISMREESGAKIVAEMSGKKVPWVVDPTLLIDVNLFPKCADNEEPSRDPYIFEYFLGEKGSGPFSCSNIVARELEINIVLSDTDINMNLFFRRLNVRQKISIQSWICRIKNARCVVTNSFHATIFSIINHRPFVAVLKDDVHAGMNERIISVLKRLGLEGNMVAGSDESVILNILNRHDYIDWNIVDSRINAWRNETEVFFRNVFGGES